MARISIMQNAFTGGEWSKQLYGRNDLELYQQGLATALNATISPSGGFFGRPGFRYKANAGQNDNPVRLIPFTFNKDQSYVLEMGHQYMRFFTDGGQVAASANLVTNPDFNSSIGSWSSLSVGAASISWNSAVSAMNLTGVGGASAWGEQGFTTSAVNTKHLVNFSVSGASADVYMRIGTSTGAQDIFSQKKFLQGEHQETFTPTNSATYLGFHHSNSATWQIDSVQVSKAAYEIETPWSASQISAVDFAQDADVMYMTHPKHAVRELARNDNDNWSLSTAIVAGNSALNASAGLFPSAVTLFQQRLWLAGTDENPQTIYASETDGLTNFQTSAAATAPLEYEIASNEVNQVLWLADSKRLIAGTTGGIWEIGGTSLDSPITPTNVLFKKIVQTGSSDLSGIMAGSHVVFVERTGSRLLEAAFDWRINTYQANDLNRINPDLFGSTVKQFVHSPNPDNQLLAVGGDGVLCVLARESSEQLTAWSRIISGIIESACVIPGDTMDEWWVAIERTVDGTVRRYVERIDGDYGSDVRDAFFVDSGLTHDVSGVITGASKTDPVVLTLSSMPFQDGDTIRIRNIVGMTELNNNSYTVANRTTTTLELTGLDGTGFTAYDSGGLSEKMVSSVSNLDHLEGETVAVLADGGAHPDRTVSSGSITLDDSYAKVHAGLGYNVDLFTLPIEGGADDGVSFGKVKRLLAASVRYYKTVGAKIGPNADDLSIVKFRMPNDVMGQAISPVTDVKSVFVRGGFDAEVQVFIRQDQPLPFNVLSIASEISTGERTEDQ